MWNDIHPLIIIYLVGCILVVVLTVTKIVIFWFVNWIIKANILRKNLQKLIPPDEKTPWEKIGLSLLLIGVEALLSWINVLVILWQIASQLFGIVRDQFQSAPEAIKALRFPLRNNPEMSRESVWAYMQALGVKAGQQTPGATELLQTIDEIEIYYPTFDRVVALKQLRSLNTIDDEVISAALEEDNGAAREI